MREERRRHWLEDPRWQRLVLGDWNPVIRDPIDLMRAALLIGSVLLAFLDKNLEAAPLITVLVVLVPRILDLPRPLDAAVVVGMSIQAWGNLFDFFNRYGWYDDVVHFLVPMLTCAATYVVLARLEIVPPPDRSYLRRHDLGVFLVTFLIGLGYAALYEIYEAGADAVFDSNLQESLADTNTDLLFGALGSAVGANARARGGPASQGSAAPGSGRRRGAAPRPPRWRPRGARCRFRGGTRGRGAQPRLSRDPRTPARRYGPGSCAHIPLPM